MFRKEKEAHIKIWLQQKSGKTYRLTIMIVILLRLTAESRHFLGRGSYILTCTCIKAVCQHRKWCMQKIGGHE